MRPVPLLKKKCILSVIECKKGFYKFTSFLQVKYLIICLPMEE